MREGASLFIHTSHSLKFAWERERQGGEIVSCWRLLIARIDHLMTQSLWLYYSEEVCGVFSFMVSPVKLYVSCVSVLSYAYCCTYYYSVFSSYDTIFVTMLLWFFFHVFLYAFPIENILSCVSILSYAYCCTCYSFR